VWRALALGLKLGEEPRQTAAKSVLRYLDNRKVREVFLNTIYDNDYYVRLESLNTMKRALRDFPELEIRNFLKTLRDDYFQNGELTEHHFTELREPDLMEAVPFRGSSYSTGEGFLPENPMKYWKKLALIFRESANVVAEEWLKLLHNENSSLALKSISLLILATHDYDRLPAEVLRLLENKHDIARIHGIYSLRLFYSSKPASLPVINAVMQIITNDKEPSLIRLFALETIGVISHGMTVMFPVEKILTIGDIEPLKPWDLPGDTITGKHLLHAWEVYPNSSGLTAYAAALYAKYDRQALEDLIAVIKATKVSDHRGGGYSTKDSWWVIPDRSGFSPLNSDPTASTTKSLKQEILLTYLKSFAQNPDRKLMHSQVNPVENYINETTLDEVLATLAHTADALWIQRLLQNQPSKQD
jgi:hypothetical protein